MVAVVSKSNLTPNSDAREVPTACKALCRARRLASR